MRLGIFFLAVGSSGVRWAAIIKTNCGYVALAAPPANGHCVYPAAIP
jgi:hypothetical protein